MLKKITLAVLTAILFSSLSVAQATVFFGRSTVSTWSGGVKVAEVQASSLSVGYSTWAGMNHATADLYVRDTYSSDRRPVYTYVYSTYKTIWYRDMPGGKKYPTVLSKLGNYVASPATNTSWRGSLSSFFNRTPHFTKGIIVGSCVEVPYWFDTCNTTSRETNRIND